MCDQQSLRSACAYAQSDQSLCQSLEYSMTVKLLAEHHLDFLSLKGGCTGWSESPLVKMPHCWKSHVAGKVPRNLNMQDRVSKGWSQVKNFWKCTLLIQKTFTLILKQEMKLGFTTGTQIIKKSPCNGSALAHPT